MDDVLGAPSRSWKNDKAALATWSPVRCVYVTRLDGHVDDDVAQQLVKNGNDVLERGGKLVAFHDWSSVTSYDSLARKTLTDWGLAIRGDVLGVHIYVTNKIVRMGVSVASMVLTGMLVSHADPAAFRACMREEIERRRALRATGSFGKL